MSTNSICFLNSSISSMRIHEPLIYTSEVLNIDRDLKTKTIPYILANEVGLVETYTKIDAVAPLKKGFHLGFSCWFNFDVVAKRSSEGAILMDKSSRVHEFMELTRQTILESNNRFEFVDLILKELLGQEEIYYRKSLDVETKIRAELTREGSWLFSDSSFEYIKKLYLEKAILHLRMDITDTRGFLSIHNWMSKSNLLLDTLYVSNIGDWLAHDHTELESMHAGIQQVISPHTLIIDVSDSFVDREKNDRGLRQKVFTGTDFNPLAARKTHFV